MFKAFMSCLWQRYKAKDLLCRSHLCFTTELKLLSLVMRNWRQSAFAPYVVVVLVSSFLAYSETISDLYLCSAHTCFCLLPQ